MTSKDITDRNDIVVLVDKFYDKVKVDPVLAPVFSHLDWSKHLPTMYNFWSSIVFGDMSYQGSPFQKHVNLTINATHFEKWLTLFHETVDELFDGITAQELKDRAQSIARVFQYKMGIMNGEPPTSTTSKRT